MSWLLFDMKPGAGNDLVDEVALRLLGERSGRSVIVE